VVKISSNKNAELINQIRIKCALLHVDIMSYSSHL